MKRSLRAGCIAAAVTLTIGTVASLANAEEGRDLRLSDATVTAGRTFTLSGDGCAPADTQWIFVTVGDMQRMVPNGEDGAWSAEFQVGSAAIGDLPVVARCGLTQDGWDYAPTTVNVVLDGEYGTQIEPRLWLSHPTVTAGRVVFVSGLGCSSQVQVQVAEQTESVTPESGSWRAGIRIPEGSLGELLVTATCTGDDTVTYPAAVVNVVPDGNLGFPPIPDAGDEDPTTETPAPSPDPTSSTPTDKPALPRSGW